MDHSYDVLTNAAFKFGELSQTERAGIIALYMQEGQEKIYEFARARKILPFIAVLLLQLGIDEEYWHKIARKYRERNELIIANLDQVFGKLSENGVKKVFVTENFGAFLAADVDKALFASGDVDLYADISKKEQIYMSFKQLGYTMEERYSHNQLINTNFFSPDPYLQGFYFGVAWNPLSRMKLPCFVEPDSFVEWDNLWKYKDTMIVLPDKEALMYICLLHISLHSFSRAPDIRLYVDINNVSRLSVDWQKVIGFAMRDNTCVRLLTACILARKILEVPVPDEIVNQQALYRKSIPYILRIVYNKENNCLLYEPGAFKVLILEGLCDDLGILHGFMKMLFPDRTWVQKQYLRSSESLLMGYYRHIKNLF